MTVTISLLHASYRRPGGPREVRDAWLSRAADADSVEYLLSMDADDAATVALTEDIPRLVNPPWPGKVTAVRNWNAAAAAATGGLLMVIADDLFPPPGWDRALVDVIGHLDPDRTPFAVKVADDPRPGDVLLRHPVVSRAFYRRFGLFSPAFHGVYCDDEFTTRAFWQALIVDGRSLRFEHRSPAPVGGAARSDSRRRLNQPDEYRLGQARYRAAWSWLKREARPRVVPASAVDRLSDRRLTMTQHALRAVAGVDCIAGLPWRTAQRAVRRTRRSLQP